MKKLLPIFFIIGIIITGIFSLSAGSVSVPIENIFSLKETPEYVRTIIFNLRLPRIVMAVLIGMMLSTSGAVLQTVFKNPLADPYIIGISASAAFGAVTAFIFNLPDFMYGVLAFIFSVLSTMFIFKMAKKGDKINVTVLLITGTAVSSFLGAFTSFAVYLIGEDSFKITMWTMGYLGNATWERVVCVFIPLVFSTGYFYMKRHELDALLLGDEEAHSLGVDVHRFKIKILVVSSLVTAFSVAFSGMIGFVGLIIPHTMRILAGSSNGKLLPNVILAGGLFLLVCDTAGRTVFAPVEIPIGVITAFFGVPFFLYLAFSKRGEFQWK